MILSEAEIAARLIDKESLRLFLVYFEKLFILFCLGFFSSKGFVVGTVKTKGNCLYFVTSRIDLDIL